MTTVLKRYINVKFLLDAGVFLMTKKKEKPVVLCEHLKTGICGIKRCELNPIPIGCMTFEPEHLEPCKDVKIQCECKRLSELL
jgi:hypothetical protein